MTTRFWREFVPIGEKETALTTLVNGDITVIKIGCTIILLLPIFCTIGFCCQIGGIAMIGMAHNPLKISGKCFSAENVLNHHFIHSLLLD